MSQTVRSAIINAVVTVMVSALAGGVVWYSIVESRLGRVEIRLDMQEKKLELLEAHARMQKEIIESVARDVSYIKGRIEPR